MTHNKQNPDFLHIGDKILKWYEVHGRDLPFRKTKDPYKIWICEIVFQQTRISQGLNHYENFVKRFPDVKTLSEANSEEVMLYWKGLGYYSRALNIHKASKQIMQDFDGVFPKNYDDILSLKGIGKYTAAAISSICFLEQRPAIDGNFYRVLSRIFADDFDISLSTAFDYFSVISKKVMPSNQAGNFNQAMMDLGSEICKPKNPSCEICPVNKDCTAFQTETVSKFPVKIKKTVPKNLKLQYYFVSYKESFLIKQRDESFIWKKLFEFPTTIPEHFEGLNYKPTIIKHKLTHLNLEIEIHRIDLTSEKDFKNFSEKEGFMISNGEDFHSKSFPKPLENYIEKHFRV